MKDLFNLITDKEIKFEEAIKHFKDKLPVTPQAFYKIAKEYRTFTFTVSGYTKIQVLKKFYDELLKSLEEGTTMKEFKEQMNGFLEKKGYEGISNYQADNIFRTNIQTAYQVGHYKQMTSSEVLQLRPYWQYDAVNDRKTRLTHRAMEGKVYRADDPIWDIWYPPNGYRCRCGVKTLSERQVRERGLNVETKPPVAAEVDGHFVNILPDKNFDTNPAKIEFNPDLRDYPKSLKKAFEDREKNKNV